MMQIPELVFDIGLWAALAAVAAGALYLLVAFIRERRRGELW